MNRFLRWAAVLAITVYLTPTWAGAGELPLLPMKLKYDPSYILETVAREMNVTLRPDIPVPAIFIESATPLKRFQEAISTQWKFRPHVFANAYAVARNEIYLMDDASYYARRKRTLDDSLAHELAHYIQVRYLNADLADPSWENDAVAVQDRFREGHAASISADAGVSIERVSVRDPRSRTPDLSRTETDSASPLMQHASLRYVQQVSRAGRSGTLWESRFGPSLSVAAGWAAARVMNSPIEVKASAPAPFRLRRRAATSPLAARGAAGRARARSRAAAWPGPSEFESAVPGAGAARRAR